LGVTALSKEEVAAHLKNNSPKPVQPLTQDEVRQARTLWISGKYHSHAIAKSLEMEMDEFNRYNPDFDKLLGTSDNRYELKLPASKMDMFIRNKYEILQLSLELLLNTNSITATRS
jgi:membrane-bound lytic murein transglycosylase D